MNNQLFLDTVKQRRKEGVTWAKITKELAAKGLKSSTGALMDQGAVNKLALTLAPNLRSRATKPKTKKYRKRAEVSTQTTPRFRGLEDRIEYAASILRTQLDDKVSIALYILGEK